MKLSNPTYTTFEQGQEFLKEFLGSSSAFYLCSTVVFRKEETDYIVKDRWKDPYKTNEENINIINNNNFLIISKFLFKRISRCGLINNVIQPGDNLIIEM